MLIAEVCCLDEGEGIEPFAALNETGNDARREPFAIADDDVLCSLAQVLNEIHAKEYRPQLLQEGVGLVEQFYLIYWVLENRVYHGVVALYHLLV